MSDELLRGLQDKNVPLSNLLRMAKVRMSRGSETKMLKWVNKELDGYGKKEAVPEYRKVRGQVKAWNPFHGWVPVIFGDAEAQSTISTRGTSQSVGELEELLLSDSPDFMMPFPDAVTADMLQRNGFQTQSALFIARSALVGILNTVRNKLFDWLLNQEVSDIAIIEPPKNEVATLQFDGLDDGRRLQFGGQSIELSKGDNETDAVLLVQTLSKEPDRYWHADEIYEDWRLLPQDITDKKAYFAARKVNDAVREKTGVVDFIEHTTTKFRVNPKYLHVDK